jgi:hypothetical protein
MKTTYRRLGMRAVITIVAAGVCLLPTEAVLGQSQYAATASDADAKLRTLTDTIERELLTSQSMPSDITTTFASAVELLPRASIAGRQAVIDLPGRLRAKASERRNDGSLVQAINLEVFAEFVTKYFTYHAATVGIGGSAVTPLSVTASTVPVSSQSAPDDVLQQIQGLQQQVQVLKEQVTQQNQELTALRANDDKTRQTAHSLQGQRRTPIRRARALPCGVHPGGAPVAVTERAAWVEGRLGRGCIFYQF